MWRQVERKILQVQRSTGIEIIILDDDSFRINVNTAKITLNKIYKGDEITGMTDLSQLKSKLDTSVPVSLVFNGKGVLIKKVSAQNTVNIQSVLPNAHPSDFYFQTWLGKEFKLIGIVRKVTAQGIINSFKDMGFKILSVSIGFSTLDNIMPFMRPGLEDQLETDSLLIDLESNNEFKDFKVKTTINNNKYQPGEYLIANQYVKPSNILSFSAAVGLLADDLKTKKTMEIEVVEEERKEYRYYKLFRCCGIAFLSVLFTFLLINFFVYTHYYNKNREFAATSVYSNFQGNNIRSLEQNIISKEKFLAQSGWVEGSRTSFYADRIASLTPADVLLTAMHIYPTRSGVSSQENLTLFKRDTIMITGVCENPVELNLFMNNLKVLSEFKDVTIKSYQYRNDQESGSFSLEILAQ